ncbi:DUF3769 domain-containing protein [Synechococcus sp. RSCCF101]|uniref:DUF3769 domain-containing protein n=1 Tax=Synechococcus sp. RSCCF101 TaxID=2511069 RepID=UPI0012490F12|nr:DUF3769 domain-containing protein [Synechococcus sp. RSCCF101]QEY32271.1 DUF3769 domain-containing protein [Synechococcus sp. RSCCF101]
MLAACGWLAALHPCPAWASESPEQESVPASVEPSLQEPPVELRLRADQQRLDQARNRYLAIGRASAVIAGGRLEADRIEFDLTTRTLWARGSVRFRRGDQYLQASSLRFNTLQNEGELRDVYGVLDLETAPADLQLNSSQPEAAEPADAAAQPGVNGPRRPAEPSAEVDSVPEPEPPPLGPVACPPDLPPVPDWHPHPWAATVWGGQMTDSNFGDTFIFNGRLRPETLLGVGLQRRLLRAGPFALELDTNLMSHVAASQEGGFNQSDPFADTPAQSFAEVTGGLGLRVWARPWLSLAVVEGVSWNSSLSNYERTFRENSAQLLNYLGFEVEAKVNQRLSAVGRIHHRSGAFGTYSGVREGSNAYLLGVRYRWGEQRPPIAQAPVPPPLGCPDPYRDSRPDPSSLQERLETVAMGADPIESTRPEPPAPRPAPERTLRQQEEAREQAIAAIDQRIDSIQLRQRLKVERRIGLSDDDSRNAAEFNDFGGIRPTQLRNLEREELVKGSISRWRIQASRVRITPEGWRAERMAFSNDPYTPAQTWVDSENVVAVQDENGDTLITADRNRLIVENRLPIPVSRQQRIRQEEEVENRWVFGIDNEDRDGFFIGRRMEPIELGEALELQLEPQVMVQRAIDGETDSYIAPGSAIGSSKVTQPTDGSDLFGLEARLRGELLGLNTDARLELTTLNPDNLPNGTRAQLDLDRSVRLPLLGPTTARLFGAYRLRVWNGSLGEQDVYSAYGFSLEQRREWRWGKLANSAFWRTGISNVNSEGFDSDNLLDLWRFNAIGSINSSYPLWRGKPAERTPQAAYRYSPVPIVPGLDLRSNLRVRVSAFSDGRSQNTLSLTGGPTLTLGTFSKPVLDFTQLTLTGGGTLRQGASPFSFDRAVDLGTVGIGLKQQIAGPLLLNAGVGLNVDPNSEFYGDVTDSLVEVRWQRRSYDFGFYYNPYRGIGGFRFRLNDFTFKGTGVPFVPYTPGAPELDPGLRPSLF